MKGSDSMLYPLSPPLMELLILSIINREDSYGYQISQQLKTVSNLKDSALYPVLKRLAENGRVMVYEQPYQGRNRKYYHMSDTGREYYQGLLKAWAAYTTAINQILDGKGGVS